MSTGSINNFINTLFQNIPNWISQAQNQINTQNNTATTNTNNNTYNGSLYFPLTDSVSLNSGGLSTIEPLLNMNYLQSLIPYLTDEGKELFINIFENIFAIDGMDFDMALSFLNSFSVDMQNKFMQEFYTALVYQSNSDNNNIGLLRELDTEQQATFLQKFKEFMADNNITVDDNITFVQAYSLLQNFSLEYQNNFLEELSTVIDIEALKNNNGIPFDIESESIDNYINNLPRSEWGNAMGLPSEIAGVFEAKNYLAGFANSFGDFTFLTKLYGMQIKTDIYKTSQNIINALAYLQSTDIQPNPNFAYIKGMPQYKDASPSLKKKYDAIHKELVRKALQYLEQIQTRLEQTSQGVNNMIQLADSQKTYQDGIIKNSLQAK